MKYPVGIQDFGEIIRGGYVYVDKTPLIWQLIDRGKYYFLSRPRRFGKSLLLSTIAAYFSGKQDLFQGLAIAEKAAEWGEHPVLRLDLGGQHYRNVADLLERLDWSLKRWEKQYAVTDSEGSVSLRFESVLQQACEQTGRHVVILIDEYDKPLLETLNNPPLQDEYRAILRAFYFNLKSCDDCIEFAMLTGVTKFSKLSIFSDLNNLDDISMGNDFSTLCGITAEELETYFITGLEDLAKKNNLSMDEARACLKRQYDGYKFSKKGESVYNPFSLLKALRSGEFNDYWFETGTPDFLVKMLAQENFSLENLPNEPVDATGFDTLDTLNSNPLPILYQSGYLTIDHYDDLGVYYLRFPNEEVERSFLKQLLPLQIAKGQQPTSSLLIRMIGHIRQGQPEAFMAELEALLADIPYEQGKPGEIYFRNLLFTIFQLVGFYCEVEHPVAGGRSDVVLKTDQYIYVLELKVDQSAEAALQQIEEKGYATPYAADPRKLFKLGVNFSTKSKQIDEWRIVEA
ncbi:MAG: AAA family ATPase [Deltaproteobacteria bacterium]|nr:AAA family ATPase [Deltaproteobacteria bacterium]